MSHTGSSGDSSPDLRRRRSRRPHAQEDTAEAAGERLRQLNIGEGDDREHNRMIRSQYRELISTVQQNRESMLNSKSNRLTEALEEANRLFDGVCRAREAALDAQFLVIASNIGKEKANELHSEMSAFDSTAFAEDLLTFMGINRTEVEEADDSEDVPGDFLPSHAWQKMGEEAPKYFRRAPTFHYMMGSFKSEPPVRKQRIERQKKASRGKAERAMPAQLKEMEQSHQEATEKEVERILRILQTHFENDPNTPISYFDFVIDPNSFARTVENVFHVSFLARDGLAKIKLDEDALPIIEPVKPSEGGEEDSRAAAQNQVVISLDQREWKEIIETFQITEAMITPLYQSTEEEMETE
ncbi:non-structural maintenance of chromosomes element 4 homolog A isoform X1 [Ammospiza nelsoni]|uniref:non-structural maintenance of chromosomes element 4 homolog A n=2 Tax=Ammospiza TaxID=2517974 RepID=UPI002739DF92|nr:non-structural maintenance of chromosomes element 4 homolog A [Ammospiza caudacuta]XP_059332874.1 non-structural maintenance of chromosomes element 4 homolog A isoform X1 [Ammospiza nelsoni]